jgi:cell division protein ZapA (FtsZ GTPase activity inhibitor)
MSSKNNTIVQIFGHQYRIASDSADASYVEEAAALLDGRMRQVASSTRRKVPLEIAIQAAMEIADEVLKARGQRDQMLSDADERISRFTRKLEDGADSPADDEPKPRF